MKYQFLKHKIMKHDFFKHDIYETRLNKTRWNFNFTSKLKLNVESYTWILFLTLKL